MVEQGRLEFLDVLRGFAILTITVNHFSQLTFKMGRSGFPVPTLTQFGYSSAAELFIITSGLLFGLVYFGKSQPAFLRKALDRLAKIYLMNGFLLSLVILFVLSGGSELSDASRMSVNGVLDVSAVRQTLTAMGGPFLLDILPLYIHLILITVLIRLIAPDPARAIMLSVGLYLIGQLTPRAAPVPMFASGFNPLSWQLPFVVAANVALPLRTWLQGQRPGRFVTYFLFAIAIFTPLAICCFLGELWSIPWLKLAGPLTDKWHLGPVRLIHSLLMFAMLSFGFLLLQQWAPRSFMLLARIGTCSLETFGASVVVVYAACAIWLMGPRSSLSYYLLTILAVIAVALFGAGLQKWRVMERKARMKPGAT